MGDVVRTTERADARPRSGSPGGASGWRSWTRARRAGRAAAAGGRAASCCRAGSAAQDLAALEDGWLRLFDPFPWDRETSEAIWLRGRSAVRPRRAAARQPDDKLEAAGGLWALVDAARHCSDAASRAMLLDAGAHASRGARRRALRAALRPLSMLAALAVRDCRRANRSSRKARRRVPRRCCVTA